MNEKQRVRQIVRASRASRVADAASARTASDGVTRELIASVQHNRAKRIACFVGAKGEPDTEAFLSWAAAQHIEVFLPRSRPDRHLEWGLFSAGALSPGAFGIPEPAGPAVPSTVLSSVDLVLVPAAAVALDGTRLGWGLGYYDRELAALRNGSGSGTIFIPAAHTASGMRPEAHDTGVPRVLAVVFEDEIFDTLPREPHDVPVDGVISEVRTRYFG